MSSSCLLIEANAGSDSRLQATGRSRASQPPKAFFQTLGAHPSSSARAAKFQMLIKGPGFFKHLPIQPKLQPIVKLGTVHGSPFPMCIT
jgi:hypothetical protein